MALNNMQERLERTVFEAIRKLAVAEGYWPDEPALVGTIGGQSTLEAAVAAIRVTKGFAVEIFGVGSSQSKYQKKVPRIVLISRRSIMGDLGGQFSQIIQNDPNQPHLYITGSGTARSSHLGIDVHIVSETAQQDRVLSAIVTQSLGQLKHIQLYDDPTSWVLLRQYNYFDIPDVQEGIIEKNIGYEFPDVFLEDNTIDTIPAALIKEIHADIQVLTPGAVMTPNGVVNGSSELGSEIDIP